MGGRDAREACELILASGPFARRDEHSREQPAEEDAHAGADQPRLDRELDEEDATERKRDAADPDDPARTKALLETFPRRGGFFRRRGLRRVLDDCVGCGFVHALWRRWPDGFGRNKRLFGDRRYLGRGLRRRLNAARQLRDAQF